MAWACSLVRGGKEKCQLKPREYVKTAIEFPANNGSKDGESFLGFHINGQWKISL